MALSTTERLKVFEILGFPPNATVYQLIGPLGKANAIQHWTFNAASTAIDALVALMSTEQEELVRNLIAEWDEVSTDETELTKAESIEGQVSSASAKRRLIRERIQTHIPLYEEGELEIRERERLYGSRGGHILRT